MKQSKEQLAKNREVLIKKHRQSKGHVCTSKTPTQNWYDNYDSIFGKGSKNERYGHGGHKH